MSSSPYHKCGALLNQHLAQRRGLKALAGQKKAAPDKATYATVCKTMQHVAVIDAVLDANKKELRRAIGFDAIRDKGLLYVLLYELLFGKYRTIRGGGKVKRMIVKQEARLRGEVEKYAARHGGLPGEAAGGRGAQFPRYVRVNTLRTSVSEVVERLRGDFPSKTEEATTANQNSETQKEQSSSVFADRHVPDLLVLPPTASSLLHREHDLVKSGRIVLQDKSSCFSALVLARGLPRTAEDEAAAPPCDYIDACAAPGNKTSHLAALVRSSLGEGPTPKKKKKKKGTTNGPDSTVFAFDRDSTRFGILQERMGLLVPAPAGVRVAVEPIHGDFLKADPSDAMFANVRAIMLDPSCSGSGIVNSPDRWTDKGNEAKDKQRMTSLSNFQVVALKHAMSFPNVDRLVYSTCSVHAEENEAVVAEALAAVEDPEDGNAWELVAPACLEHWPRRGKEGGIGGLTEKQAACLIRCDGLDGDDTNGFFVSFFARKKLSAAQGPATARAALTHADVPVYEGQFREARDDSDAEAPPACDADEAESTEPDTKPKPPVPRLDKKEPGKQKKAPARKANEVKKTLAKKGEKKLAWKRKQALQKMRRLDSTATEANPAESKDSARKPKSPMPKTKHDPSAAKAPEKTAQKGGKKQALKRKQAAKKLARQKKKAEAAAAKTNTDNT